MDPNEDPNADPAADPNLDPAADPNVDPVGDPNPGDPQGDKEQKRQGFAERQAQKRLKALEDELAGYKRRDDEARKAQLTEEQRLKEETDTLRQENERLKTERLQQKVAAEFKLPPSLAARLIGSDEEALRADAEDLAKLLPRSKVGNQTDPTRENGGLPTFKRSQLRDPKFFAANRDAILQAQREGRIVEG